MGLGNSETDVSVDDGDGDVCAGRGGDGFRGKSFGSVSCSICLEAVMDNGNRSWAKLQCGHEFHLDCIGSAFNIKGAMQCPNCRKIEKGRWLYANSYRSLPEFGMDDWTHDDDLYDLSYSEMSLGVHWCPFGSLARLPSLFDEGESSSNTYDLIRQQSIFAEQAATVSSATHSRPYIAYFGPIPPSSLNSRESVSNGSNFNNHWSGLSIPSEMPSSYGFPSLNLQYHSWDHHSPPLSTTGGHPGSAEQLIIQPSVTQRLPRTSPDAPRSGSFMPPFVPSHSSSARAVSSVRSPMVPHYQGSNARNRDRVQALQAYYQQPTNAPGIRTALPTGTRRPNSHRGLSYVGTESSTSDQNVLYIPPSSVWDFQDVENPPPGRFRTWERDPLPSFSSNQIERESGWGSFHQATNRQRHGSERMSSQNRS